VLLPFSLSLEAWRSRLYTVWNPRNFLHYVHATLFILLFCCITNITILVMIQWQLSNIIRSFFPFSFFPRGSFWYHLVFLFSNIMNDLLCSHLLAKFVAQPLNKFGSLLEELMWHICLFFGFFGEGVARKQNSWYLINYHIYSSLLFIKHSYLLHALILNITIASNALVSNFEKLMQLSLTPPPPPEMPQSLKNQKKANKKVKENK